MERLLVAVLLVAFLGGCGTSRTIGKDFKRPTPTQLALGRTTEAEITAVYGPPMGDHLLTRSENAPTPRSEFDPAALPGQFVSKDYFFMTSGGGKPPNTREVLFTFYDGILVGYKSQSDFPTDTTFFDGGKIEQIIPGKSTKDDIVRLFGDPGGMSIYPVIADRSSKLLTYRYEDLDVGRQIKIFELNVLISANDVVRDYKVDNTVTQLDTSGGSTAPTIIFLPMYHHK